MKDKKKLNELTLRLEYDKKDQAGIDNSRSWGKFPETPQDAQISQHQRATECLERSLHICSSMVTGDGKRHLARLAAGPLSRRAAMISSEIIFGLVEATPVGSRF